MTINLFSQSEKILSGPMLSYIDGYSTQMWFLLESDVSSIDVKIRDYEEDKLKEYHFKKVI